MKMSHKESGKYIKLDVMAPKLWTLVDSWEEATVDPAYVAGQDHTLTMLRVLPLGMYEVVMKEPT